jgi:Holliday junction resolvase RusA-like endonuclease
VRLVFNFEPVAQARPRMTARPYPHMYDPAPVKAFKRRVGAEATKQLAELGQTASDKAMSVVIRFYRPLQKSLSKPEAARRANEIKLPTVKPDVDNYVKSFLDGLNGVIWQDDSQIVSLTAKKAYSSRPRIELEVYEINGELNNG